MTRVQLLEREVKKLDKASLQAFRSWFQHYDSDEWDRQIERDSKNGKLDKLAKAALTEHKAGKTREI